MSAALEQKVEQQEAELTDGFHLVIDALKLNGIKTSITSRASRSPIWAAWRRRPGCG